MRAAHGSPVDVREVADGWYGIQEGGAVRLSAEDLAVGAHHSDEELDLTGGLEGVDGRVGRRSAGCSGVFRTARSRH